MTYEFLIKRTDGDWFDLHKDGMDEVFKPSNGSNTEGAGDYRVAIGDATIEVNFEDQGFHIIFSNFSDTEAEVTKYVDEMLTRLETVSGQSGEIIRIT